MKTQWQVAAAAEALPAAQFARCGWDVSVQYGANQPVDDLVVVDKGRVQSKVAGMEVILQPCSTRQVLQGFLHRVPVALNCFSTLRGQAQARAGFLAGVTLLDLDVPRGLQFAQMRV